MTNVLKIFLGLQFVASAFAGEPLRVVIDPAVTHQTIDGFGASDAWQCQFVGKNWPLEKRRRIADLLFSREVDAQGKPKGIGLSIWRFYLGAGTTEQGEASGIRNPWRRAECFQNPDGSYDWSKMAGQQWFLQAARDRGVERFLAFPNAAPVQLSENGKGYATKGDIHLNLKPGAMKNYADYLVDVMEHFTQTGRPFDYLSPVNEPQWNWDGADQEGTPALNEEIHGLVRHLSHGLSARKLKTQIVIGEAGTIGHVAMRMGRFGLPEDGRDDQARCFFNEASPFYIGNLPNVAPIISAHSYQSVWPLEKQVEYRRIVHGALQSAATRLGYWQSEYCIIEENGEIGGGNRRDLGMDTALYVARIIHHDMTLTNARSWQWWTALSQVDYKDGLIHLDDGSAGETGRMGPETTSLIHDGAVRESKLLWVFGNYSRFVRPGMVRVGCRTEPEQSFKDGLLASAYRGAGGETVAVLVNLSREELHCDLGSPATAKVYTTSTGLSLESGTQSCSNITIPARAVVTVCAVLP
ncbi:MAG: glycoside hydrolase [Verrucomicrobiota bacterium]